MSLGAPLSEPHSCKLIGADVNSTAAHGLSCRHRKDRHPDILPSMTLSKGPLAPSMSQANFSHHDQLQARIHMSQTDGKCLDGASIVPWKFGKALVWDFTYTDTLVLSYQSLSTREAGAAADEATNEGNYRSTPT